ncbi:MAG: hypothetical protein QW756_01470 [Nitrososphaerota archaeon]
MSQDQGHDLRAMDNGEESPEKIMNELGLGAAELKRYLRAAKRLRELERRYGKSYHILLRDYEKKLRESVKLEYTLNELREKRSKIEEDLRIYLDQHKLTLENVNKTVRLMSALEKYGVTLEDLESFVRIVVRMKEMGWNTGEIIKVLESVETIKASVKELENERTRLESNVEALKNSIKEKEQKLKELTGIEPDIVSLAEVRNRLGEEVKALERRLDEQAARLEELAKEYEVLAGMKGTAHEIYRELQERKSMLQRLDEEIARKSETVKVLEEEVEAARSLLTLLQEPETVRKEDLEALSHQLNNIVKVRSGELPMLKPLEEPLIQNARKRVVELVWPAIKNEFVPKWVFDKLEKEVKELVSRKSQLESEVEALTREKEELKRRLAEIPISRQPAPARVDEGVARIFTLRDAGRELSATEKKVNVKCTHCTTFNLMHLPTYDELQSAIAAKDRLVLSCTSCGKSISLDPSVLTRFYRSGTYE